MRRRRPEADAFLAAWEEARHEGDRVRGPPDRRSCFHPARCQFCKREFRVERPDAPGAYEVHLYRTGRASYYGQVACQACVASMGGPV